MGQSSQGKNIEKILSILKKEYKNWDENVATVKQMIKVHNFEPFKSLIMAIISTQTKDSITSKVSEKLFQIANSPKEILKIPDKELENTLKSVSFYKRKAKYIKDTCRIIIEEYKNKIPSNFDKLIKLPGVGRKVANVFLSHVYKKDVIAVDTHVHRISNRLKWVNTKNPNQTEKELYKVVPKRLWRDINLYLVAFGQAICSYKPKCSICPIYELCPYENKRL
ncbi:MAG: endonuclease III [candidate division WOR-3 bacterium]|nr:endonuclease III [candidate division WOR-3 bacterium]MCX7947325.1 endonuclease III [candidate division WOR-3 bacterium]MDW8150119.1 endonuclease III [candidate division WOR-3 bacterium]